MKVVNCMLQNGVSTLTVMHISGACSESLTWSGLSMVNLESRSCRIQVSLCTPLYPSIAL